MGATESLAPRGIACSALVQILASCKKGSLRQAISSMQHETGLRIAENPELASVARPWIDDQYHLFSDKDLRTQLFFRALLRAYENQHYQHEDGTFDDEM